MSLEYVTNNKVQCPYDACYFKGSIVEGTKVTEKPQTLTEMKQVEYDTRKDVIENYQIQVSEEVKELKQNIRSDIE